MNAVASIAEAMSSDETFASSTSVVAVDAWGLAARLKEVQDACIVLQNDDNNAKGEFEKRHARFITDAYELAFKLMQEDNRTLLTQLVLDKMREPLGANDSRMLGQIAVLVVGKSVVDQKTGQSSWKVPHKRDIRLAQFFRIFWGDAEKWQTETLYDTILKHPGKTGGILAAAKKRGKVERTKEQKSQNEQLATRLPALGKVPVAGITPKAGSWKLALVQVDFGAVHVREIVTGQETLAARLAEEWCAANAPLGQVSATFNATPETEAA